MTVPRILERSNDFVILVNSYPFFEKEIWDKEKQIIRVWGRDGLNKKINYVIYPKKYYTKEYIENSILPQYNTCPKCQIGEEIKIEMKKVDEFKKHLKEKISDKKKYGNIALGGIFLFIPLGIALGIYHQYKKT